MLVAPNKSDTLLLAARGPRPMPTPTAHARWLSPQVIDNDRLTLANLSRIKHLEAQLVEISAQLDEQA